METVIKSSIEFTEGAIAEINRLMNDLSIDGFKQLRIGVKGGGCSGMTYVLGFDEQTSDDVVYGFENIQFIINKGHELYLFGMKIDWQGGLNSRGFTFINPNASSTCGCGTSFSV